MHLSRYEPKSTTIIVCRSNSRKHEETKTLLLFCRGQNATRLIILCHTFYFFETNVDHRHSERNDTDRRDDVQRNWFHHDNTSTVSARAHRADAITNSSVFLSTLFHRAVTSFLSANSGTRYGPHHSRSPAQTGR